MIMLACSIFQIPKNILLTGFSNQFPNYKSWLFTNIFAELDAFQAVLSTKKEYRIEVQKKYIHKNSLDFVLRTALTTSKDRTNFLKKIEAS